ncbi:nicotinamidase-like isoform X1 [Amphiura filiformis]|uniref:nicotinamidase-like isoform X1 n=1 Tax=Amphiura filiformis TaxID=82378 RepID=UPI003B212A32
MTSSAKQENFFDDFVTTRSKHTVENGNGTASEEQRCFQFFDRDGDGILNHGEFHHLCCQLLSSNDDCDQQWTNQDTDKVLQLIVKQEEVDEDKFKNVWKSWIKPILSPKCALLVVDVQNDFISGSLALKNAPAKQNGEEVVPVINRLIETVNFDKVIFSQDWHPDNHISFYKNRHIRNFHSSSPIAAEEAKLIDTVVFAGHNGEPIEQTLWPAHCVQHSTGAQLHKDLQVEANHIRARKGTNPEHDSYSVLYPTPEPNNNTSGPALVKQLKQQGITDLYICGLALDICVGCTVLDACRLGFRTIVVEDASRMLDEDRTLKMKRKMKAAGCLVVTSNEVSDMVSGLVRHPKLAHVTELNIIT